MGMWINLTKKPMKPMMAKPMAVAKAIFWNSEKTNEKHFLIFMWTKKKLDRTQSLELELTFAVRLGAFLDQTVRVLEELFAWLDVFVDLIHSSSIKNLQSGSRNFRRKPSNFFV